MDKTNKWQIQSATKYKYQIQNAICIYKKYKGWFRWFRLRKCIVKYIIILYGKVGFFFSFSEAAEGCGNVSSTANFGSIDFVAVAAAAAGVFGGGDAFAADAAKAAGGRRSGLVGSHIIQLSLCSRSSSRCRFLQNRQQSRRRRCSV